MSAATTTTDRGAPASAAAAPETPTTPAAPVPPAAPTPVRVATDLARLGRTAASAYDRPDLAERLAATERRLTDPDLAVLVVGEFKQGKSSLINGLVNVPVCPVDDDVATAVPTVVRHGPEPSAVAVLDGDTPTTEPVDPLRLVDWVSEAGNPGNGKGLRSAEVRVPSRILASGLALVDTPGVGGLDSVHGVVTLGALPMAEAVVFVTDASQELSAPELDFLRHAHEICPNMVCALTKIDIYPHWREILDRDRAHLERAGLDLPLLPLSTPLRQEAARNGDTELNDESGYPALVRHLRDDVVAHAEALAVTSARRDLVTVVDQLHLQFDTERVALDEPERAEQLVAELEAARTRADELKSRSARWQQTMNDGVQDLSGDIDHRLRECTRRIVAEVDEHLEELDPTETWDEFVAWLRQRVAADLVTAYEELTERSAAVAERVSDHFALDGAVVNVDLAIGTPGELLDQLGGPDDLTQGPTSSRTLTAVRGSYGGIVMFSMLASLVGVGVFAPVSVAIGAGMGRKALREENQRQLVARRQQARATARKFVDEAAFVAAKDLRDTVRSTQRQLRDHFTSHATELQRSTGDALTAAKQAVRADETERQARLRDVRAELERIDGLRRRVEQLEVAT